MRQGSKIKKQNKSIEHMHEVSTHKNVKWIKWMEHMRQAINK
jgi:hypothetical protein